MEVFLGGSQSGKTLALIHKAHSEGLAGKCVYIACHGQAEAQRIFRLSREIGKPVRLPITYFDIAKNPGIWIDGILIDNLEMFIAAITNRANILAVSMNDDNSVLHHLVAGDILIESCRLKDEEAE